VRGGGRETLKGSHTSVSFIAEDNPYFGLCQAYLETLLRGDRRNAGQLVLDAVDGGASVKYMYLYVFQPALYEIGRLWQINRITVAEEHFFTAATQLAISQLYPYIFTSAKKELRLVAACVGDELHEVGVRMVADFFEMEGWDTYYMGANVPAASLVQKVHEFCPHVLALSATMSFHQRAVEQAIQNVRAAQGGRRVRIMVGGGCFKYLPELWRKVGADAFAPDAAQAVVLAHELIGITA